MNRAVFYDEIRDSLFGGSLSKSQVAGVEDILNAWDRLHAADDPRWLAYILATIYHETGRRMVPVREGFASTDEGAIRAVTSLFNEGRIHKNYAIPVNGVSYFGRGRVQTTFLDNYRKLEKRFKHPFVENPGILISQPEIDAEVAVTGHVEGIWTGRKLADFITPTRCDFEGCRHIVSTDRASDIANYAVKFEGAVEAGVRAPATPGHPVDTMIPKPGLIPAEPIPSASSQSGSHAVPTPQSAQQAPDLAAILQFVQQLTSGLGGASTASTAKPWYLSKGVIGGLMAVVLPIASVAFPPLAAIQPGTAADLLLKILEVAGPVVGGLFAIVGRLSAQEPIAGTHAAQPGNSSFPGQVVSGVGGIAPLNNVLGDLPTLIANIQAIRNTVATIPAAAAK